MQHKHLLLFDIDGVLLEPLGYRKATTDTILHFFSNVDIDGIDVWEDEIAAFESQGITSEWEIIPLYILTWLEVNWPEICDGRFIPSWKDFTDNCQRLPSQFSSNIDLILKLHNLLNPSLTPTNSLLLAFRQSGRIKDYFPFLSGQSWLVNELLQNDSLAYKTKLLHIFQNKIEGNAYPTEEIDTQSYLKIYDEVLISKEFVKKLESLKNHPDYRMAAMTSRPTQIQNSEGIEFWVSGNYPEAEVGLEKAGLNFLDAVGYGEMQLMNAITGIPISQLIKPHYLHAFSALCLASEIPIDQVAQFIKEQMMKSYQYVNLNQWNHGDLYNWLNDSLIHLHVFEDACIGIQSVRGLQAMLYANGIQARVHAYGIGNDANKIKSLRNENACVYPTINEAFKDFCNNYF